MALNTNSGGRDDRPFRPDTLSLCNHGNAGPARQFVCRRWRKPDVPKRLSSPDRSAKRLNSQSTALEAKKARTEQLFRDARTAVEKNLTGTILVQSTN
jgi:hypothetical protein